MVQTIRGSLLYIHNDSIKPALTSLLMLMGLYGTFGRLFLVQRNSKTVSSHMITHTPYKMAVSVKQRGRSTASWQLVSETFP